MVCHQSNAPGYNFLRNHGLQLRPKLRMCVSEGHAPAGTVAPKGSCVTVQCLLLPFNVVHGAVAVHIDSDTADASRMHFLQFLCCDRFWVDHSNTLCHIISQVGCESCQTRAVGAIGETVSQYGVGDAKAMLELDVLFYCR